MEEKGERERKEMGREGERKCMGVGMGVYIRDFQKRKEPEENLDLEGGGWCHFVVGRWIKD